MKKIIAVAFLLALVAVLAVPMAAFAATGSTTVGGSVTAGTVSVTPPTAIAFGAMKVSESPLTKQATTGAKVTVIPGSSGLEAWTMTVKSTAGLKPGWLSTSSASLTYPLLISDNGTGWVRADAPTVGASNLTPPVTPPQVYAGGALTYLGTGTQSDLDFFAKQWLTSGDDEAGTYSITLTFTVTLNTP
jgi:hypothetical protein